MLCLGVVFESPVQSSFWPLRPKTRTGTSPTKFESSKRLDQTHIGLDQCKTMVQTGHRTCLNQNWSQDLSEPELVICEKDIIYTLLNNKIY